MRITGWACLEAARMRTSGVGAPGCFFCIIRSEVVLSVVSILCHNQRQRIDSRTCACHKLDGGQ
jgi:hypothetical protein